MVTLKGTQTDAHVGQSAESPGSMPRPERSVQSGKCNMWTIDQVEINGGFLPGLKLALPRGLICIIGPRGSGKSTLAEAMRFAIKGAGGAPRQRTDLLQANLGSSGLVTVIANTGAEAAYTIRRAYKQPAVLLAADGRPIANVDLERGTFLPLDAYNSLEIEDIADEVLGAKRRALLDDLRGEELSRINLSLAEHRRALEANADRIKAARRSIEDLEERIEELGDVRARLNAMGTLPESEPSAEYTKAHRQQQCNSRERKRVEKVLDAIVSLRRDAEALRASSLDQSSFSIVEENSANSAFLKKRQAELLKTISRASENLTAVVEQIRTASACMESIRTELHDIHSRQANELAKLQQVQEVAGEKLRVRLDLEQRVAMLEEIEADRSRQKRELTVLLESRKSLKAAFLLEREQISSLRDSVARELQGETGDKVRIRVLRNADDLAYRTMLTEGLKGARVRNHDEILDSLLQLRPEQLAQFISGDDADGLDEACSFGPERARRILDAFRENIDPLELEVVEIQDQVRIELNVSTTEENIFKDAAELSRGQKCTALLPILLARRNTPLIIDQPEDNLDNHFIYETVVNSIQRLKGRRQMIFITHNANIPVLAEADLVIVLNSDGKKGYVEQSGSVDQCRDQIVDLLEGGREAFELRRKRYARP
jgi:energy-coupling factor transporter ATP-binding protein EcfA2